MVVIMSCDHHDETGLIPDTRSRARMLAQLRAAEAMGAAFLRLVTAGPLDIKLVDGIDRLTEYPTVRLDADHAAFIACWQAYMAWRRLQPSGDDWAPAFDPPSTTQITPDDAFTQG